MATHTIVEETTLTVEECCTCHIMFAMPQSLQRRARSDSNVWFYCPNGHNQHYTNTDVEKMKRLEQEADRLRRQKANAEEEARIIASERDAERRSHAHTKGELTKTRKKVKKAEHGVCPHCTRHFADLQAHVETKHPDKALSR